jgi:putative acetyltransferase
VDALRRAGRLTVSLVAAEGERLVGHVAFSPVMVGGHVGGLGPRCSP